MRLEGRRQTAPAPELWLDSHRLSASRETQPSAEGLKNPARSRVRQQPVSALGIPVGNGGVTIHPSGDTLASSAAQTLCKTLLSPRKEAAWGQLAAWPQQGPRSRPLCEVIFSLAAAGSELPCEVDDSGSWHSSGLFSAWFQGSWVGIFASSLLLSDGERKQGSFEGCGIQTAGRSACTECQALPAGRKPPCARRGTNASRCAGKASPARAEAVACEAADFLPFFKGLKTFLL